MQRMTPADQPEPILRFVEQILSSHGTGEANLPTVLDRVLAHFGCVVGTIHRLNPSSGMLELLAHRGVPKAVLDQVRAIPVGKGMAGLAAQRRQPVQVCNLQTDDSGVAKPGAKLTEMKGSIAVPMLDGQTLRGTLGLARPEEHTFSEDQTRALLGVASLIARHLA